MKTRETIQIVKTVKFEQKLKRFKFWGCVMNRNNETQQEENGQETQRRQAPETNRTQLIFQGMVSAYLFYLGVEGIVELVRGTSTIAPVILVLSSLLFIGFALFIAFRCVRAARREHMDK